VSDKYTITRKYIGCLEYSLDNIEDDEVRLDADDDIENTAFDLADEYDVELDLFGGGPAWGPRFEFSGDSLTKTTKFAKALVDFIESKGGTTNG